MTAEMQAMLEAYRQAGNAASLTRSGISVKIRETTAFDKMYPPIVEMRPMVVKIFIPVAGYSNWSVRYRAIDRAQRDPVEWQRARRRRKHRI